MKKVAKSEISNMINKNNGLLFSVLFIKADGTERKMICRTGVKKHLKGGELSFDPIEKGLLPVFDMEKKAYRMIPLDRVLSIKLAGQEWEVE
jgi:hypothetical protein